MENMENYLFEYWKINPQIRKIKNEDLGITLLKIDDEAWVDKDGHIQIRESWNNLTLLSELIKLKGKYVMYVGKHNNWNQNYSNLEPHLRIIIGKLYQAHYGPSTSKIEFDPSNSIELIIYPKSLNLNDCESDWMIRPVGKVQINNIEKMGLEIRELSNEEAINIKSSIRDNPHEIAEINRKWIFE